MITNFAKKQNLKCVEKQSLACMYLRRSNISFTSYSFLFSLILSLVLLPFCSYATADWSQFRSDNHNTGYTNNDFSDLKYDLEWSLDFSSPISTTAAIDDGEVFLVVNTSQSSEREFSLLCIDLESGDEKWRYEERYGDHNHPYLIASPLVTNDIVYFTLADGYMHAVDRATRDEVWSYDTGGPICSSPVVHDNVVFFGGTWSHTLYALDATDGSEIWTFSDPEAAIVSSPAVYNGRVYFGSWDNKIYSVDEEGNNNSPYPVDWGTTDLIWSFETSDRVYSTPLTVDDKVILMATGDDENQHIYALDCNNADVIWSHNTHSDGVPSAPATNGEIVIVGGVESSNLTAFNLEDGTPLWSVDLRFCSDSSPSISGSNVVIGNFDGNILNYNFQKGTFSTIFETERAIASSPAFSEEYFIINMGDNRTLCFKGTENSDTNGTQNGSDDDSPSFTFSTVMIATVGVACAIGTRKYFPGR